MTWRWLAASGLAFACATQPMAPAEPEFKFERPIFDAGPHRPGEPVDPADHARMEMLYGKEGLERKQAVETRLQTGSTRFERKLIQREATGATLSPDGGFVAFFTLRQQWDCSPNFIVRDLATGVDEHVFAKAPRAMGECLGAWNASLSNGGTRVAFSSRYPFVPGDVRNTEDAFVWHRESARIELVSADVRGVPGGGSSAKISDDGRFVVFLSDAKNLVANDTNDTADVFVRDLDAGTTELVSVSSAGKQANGPSRSADISADGSVVAFVSDATNLVAGDKNKKDDIFVRDRKKRSTERISVSARGSDVNDDSFDPALSGDGRYVAFVSQGTNLVNGVGKDVRPVYVRDRKLQKTEAPGVGNRPEKAARGAALSSDGRYLSYVDTHAGINDPGSLIRLDRTDRSFELVSLAGEVYSGNPRQVMSRDGKRHVFDLLLQIVLASERSDPPEKSP